VLVNHLKYFEEQFIVVQVNDYWKEIGVSISVKLSERLAPGMLIRINN